MRIRAMREARKHILNQLCHQMRLERRAVRLTHALDASVGREFYEHEVAATVVRRWVADDEGLDIRQLHRGDFPLLIDPPISIHLCARSSRGCLFRSASQEG